jgi:predicted amidohydrolase YtcJ
MKKKLLTILSLLVLIANSCSMMKQKADLIVTNARIYTVDSAFTVSEAMALGNGKILETGNADAILSRYKANVTLDLQGRPVYPGFIDAHCHFYGYALNSRNVDLNGATSFQEVLNRIKASGKYHKGEWIVGRGWDNNLWQQREFPDKQLIDREYPDNPVLLTRVDGHVVLVNEAAIKSSHIDIDRFDEAQAGRSKGRLTGIFSESAADFLRNAVPLPAEAVLKELIEKAREDCLAAGLTTVSDAGLSSKTVAFLDSLWSGEPLGSGIRIYAMLDPSRSNFETFVKSGPYATRLMRVSAVKLYADGSLGSRTALLKRPYEDMPCLSGISVTASDSIRKVCLICLEKGYQVNIHAIGDSAVKNVLDIYAAFLKGKNDLRWRIEHCQVVDPSDLPKFAEYSVIPSVQATHAVSDMLWAGDRLGHERVKWAYAYRALLNQNGWLANGTDFPIEGISPLSTFYAAVVRKNAKGQPAGGFQPENAISREEALRSITIWAAMADRWEDEIGSLEKGKNADFVILDRDIMEADENELKEIKVVETYLDGIKVYPMK